MLLEVTSLQHVGSIMCLFCLPVRASGVCLTLALTPLPCSASGLSFILPSHSYSFMRFFDVICMLTYSSTQINQIDLAG